MLDVAPLWPGWALPMLRPMVENHLGDVASIVGVLISLIGFGFTLWNSWRSKSAAERAQAAAEETRNAIRLFETVSDFSQAVAIMEEMKRLHRAGTIEILPDRYAALRKILINVRGLATNLSNEQKATLQSALATLTDIEASVEKCNLKGTKPDFVKYNTLLSRDIDAMQAMQVTLRKDIEGIGR